MVKTHKRSGGSHQSEMMMSSIIIKKEIIISLLYVRSLNVVLIKNEFVIKWDNANKNRTNRKKHCDGNDNTTIYVQICYFHCFLRTLWAQSSSPVFMSSFTFDKQEKQQNETAAPESQSPICPAVATLVVIFYANISSMTCWSAASSGSFTHYKSETRSCI